MKYIFPLEAQLEIEVYYIGWCIYEAPEGVCDYIYCFLLKVIVCTQLCSSYYKQSFPHWNLLFFSLKLKKENKRLAVLPRTSLFPW